MKIELNNYIKSHTKYGEIELFKEMKSYLSKKHTCIFIEETHQQYVKFECPTTKCNLKRELSDLWLITYSTRLKKARMTFLQAKFEKNKPKTNIPFSFKGDYFQYELLSKRPEIKDQSKFHFPNTILSSALSDSVGSFGVFYFDGKKNLDFAFSIASDISYKKKAHCKTKTKQLYFKGINYINTDIRLSKYFDVELRSTLNSDCFEFCLLNLFVGTPIETDKNTIAFLKDYFKNIYSADIQDFKNFLLTINVEVNEKNDNEYNGNPNILLINVDPKE